MPIGHVRILGIGLELACNGGSCGGISLKRNECNLNWKRLPRISLTCKLVPVRYWEYEYGLLLYSWRFSRYSGTIHWLVHGHMTSNNETVSRQMPWAGNIAKIMTSNGKQFTVTHEMLTAVARDQRWPDVVAGISVRFSKFAFVLFCYITNHLMTGPLGNSEFCFPRISMFPEPKFPGNKIHCSPRDQSLSVKCFSKVRGHTSIKSLFVCCFGCAQKGRWFTEQL